VYTTLMHVDAGLMETYIQYCTDPCTSLWEWGHSGHELFILCALLFPEFCFDCCLYVHLFICFI